MLMPTRKVEDVRSAVGPRGDRQADRHTATEVSAPTATIDWRRLGRGVRAWFIYLLFNGTSSTIAMQYPWGLTLVAFFTIVIFIVVS